MAIEIPKAEERVPYRTPTVQAPQFAKPAPAAFGAEAAAADAAIGERVSQLGSSLARVIIDQRNQDEEQEVLAADTEFRKSFQDLLYNPEQDEKSGAPKGLMHRNLNQARGATVSLQDAYAKLREEFSERVPQPRQKSALAARMDAHFIQARDLIVRHEAQQRHEAFKSDLETNLKQRVSDAAALGDPATLAAAIAQAQKVQSEGLTRIGRGEAEIRLSGELLAAEMTKTSIAAVLERDPQRAKVILEAVAPVIGKSAAASIGQAVDGKLFAEKAAAVWTEIAADNSVRLPDGSVDLAKAQAAVLARTDEPQDRKERIWDYVKARAGEELIARNRADEANDRAFYDAAIKAKGEGVPLAKALELAGGFNARDAYDVAQRAEVVKKLYAPATQTDPETFIGLWERVQSGGGSKQEIDHAFNAGALNPADWRSLRQELFRANEAGTDPVQKQAFERIKLLAEQTFGSNELRKKTFLYEMQLQGKGLKPEELLKLAQDKLAIDEKTKWSMLVPVPGTSYTIPVSFGGKPAYEADLARQDQENLAWGTLYADLGRQNVLAIGRSAMARGKGRWSLVDVAEFAGQFGGYENIRPGTPAGNAIESLAKRGELVTPANVKAVLERYKDGKY